MHGQCQQHNWTMGFVGPYDIGTVSEGGAIKFVAVHIRLVEYREHIGEEQDCA